MTGYHIADFVQDMRMFASEAATEAAVIERIKPLLARLAQSPAWVKPEHYECDPQQGFGVHVLHEEPNHGPWLVAVSWLPHHGAPPHNHGTWAVIAGIDGAERNILWRRRGERLERQAEEVVGPRQVAAFLGNAIHSVVNEGERTTLSLHVYGRNLNFVARSQFDPNTGNETPFKLRLQQTT
jgi:predicted metal-dependent enzyme (double-stranded beta helix superfamily)